MSPSWIRMSLNSMTGVLLRDRREDTDAEEKPSEDRDGRDVVTSPRKPGAP